MAGATALSNGDVAKSGERMVRSAASNEFNNSAQQWLSQFGTARVQLNINDDFHLDGSAADVLIPLYDNEKSILFTQLGARNKDSRNTVNMGPGCVPSRGTGCMVPIPSLIMISPVKPPYRRGRRSLD